MTHERDIERLLDLWLGDGPTSASDRILDAVSDRIERQRQRPAWRLHWRHSGMNTTFKLATAVATVAIVAVVGFAMFRPGTSGVGGPGPTATPSASQSQTPTISPSTTPRGLVEGPLPMGTYQIRPFSGPAAALTLTFTVPAGWAGFPDWAVLGPRTTSAPDGIGVAFLMASALYSDPCHWDAAGTGAWPQPGDISVGPTVDDLVAALRANTAYSASAPVDVTVDGYTGKQLDLQLPSDVDLSKCDNAAGNDSGAFFVWSPPTGTENDLFAQGPGARWHLRVIDVDGDRIIILIDDYAGTPAQDRAGAQAIVDSIQISR